MTSACIDVLCCALADVDADLLAHYESLLSDEELLRLRSFRSSVGAKEFLVGRALLRTVLAEHVNCKPQQLQFVKNDDGKPSLSFPPSNWQFNLSHSHDWVALALCKGASIGIDIESYRRRNNLAGIARRFFSAQENAQLEKCRKAEWLDYFFAVWTLKEAHAKALGCGLPKILNCSSIDVDFSTASIGFTLSGAASTSNNIASWLFKFEEECALAVVAHGDHFDTPDVQRCVPLQSQENFALKIMACGKSP